MSAEHALAIVDANDPLSLLITDHLMPGMSGAELARIVRHRRPSLPILLLSGYADVADVAPDLQRLAKPFRRDELAGCIATLGPA